MNYKGTALPAIIFINLSHDCEKDCSTQPELHSSDIRALAQITPRGIFSKTCNVLGLFLLIKTVLGCHNSDEIRDRCKPRPLLLKSQPTCFALFLAGKYIESAM